MPSLVHTTDALAGANSRIQTTDALLLAEESRTHTTDALNQGTSSLTHTTDASLSSGSSLSHTTDALLLAENSLTHTTDALLQAEISRTHTTDALFVLPRTHTTDALLQAENSLTHSTDALLQGEVSLTHSTDAKIAFVFDISHSTDAALSAGRQLHTTDALLFEPPEFSVYHTTSALLYEEYRGAGGPMFLTAFELIGSGEFILPEAFDPAGQILAAIGSNRRILYALWGWGVVDRFEPFSFDPCPCVSLPRQLPPKATAATKQEVVQPPGDAKVKHPKIESTTEPPRVLETFHTPIRVTSVLKESGTVRAPSIVQPAVEITLADVQAPQNAVVEHHQKIRPQFLPRRLRRIDPLIKDSLITQVDRSRRRKRRH